MKITIYGIQNCDTMKKARAWLLSHQVEYSFHDYKKAGIDGERLKEWIGKVGWEPLINRSGTTFRKLSDGDKENLNERKAIELMLSEPSMIKRPVMEISGRVIVGFKPDIYESVVLENKNK